MRKIIQAMLDAHFNSHRAEVEPAPRGGEPLGPPLPQETVWAVAFSPDGRKILTNRQRGGA